jgi:hypothetical protein
MTSDVEVPAHNEASVMDTERAIERTADVA